MQRQEQRIVKPIQVQQMAHPKRAQSETTKLCRFPLARLGSPNGHVRRLALKFRRLVEMALTDAGRIIGPWEASVIAAAATAFRQACRIDRILSDAGEPGNYAVGTKQDGGDRAVAQRGLDHNQWLAYDAALARARACVTRNLEALKLNVQPDVWDVIYRQPAIVSSHLAADATNGVQAADRPESAPDAPGASVDAGTQG
jgi:hypothetical protein